MLRLIVADGLVIYQPPQSLGMRIRADSALAIQMWPSIDVWNFTFGAHLESGGNGGDFLILYNPVFLRLIGLFVFIFLSLFLLCYASLFKCLSDVYHLWMRSPNKPPPSTGNIPSSLVVFFCFLETVTVMSKNGRKHYLLICSIQVWCNINFKWMDAVGDKLAQFPSTSFLDQMRAGLISALFLLQEEVVGPPSSQGWSLHFRKPVFVPDSHLPASMEFSPPLPVHASLSSPYKW